MSDTLFLLTAGLLMLSMPVAMLVSLWKSLQEHGLWQTIKNVFSSLIAVALVLGGLFVCAFILWLILCGGPSEYPEFIRGD